MKQTSKLFIKRLLICLILSHLALSVNAAVLEYDLGEFTDGPGAGTTFTVSAAEDPNTLYVYFRADKEKQFRYFIESTDKYSCEYHVFERYGGEREYRTRPFSNTYKIEYNNLPEGEYRIEITVKSKISGAETYNVSISVGVDNIKKEETIDTPIGFTHTSQPKVEEEPTYKQTISPGLTATRSYIRKIVPLSANGISVLESISYFDGLGRGIQTVQKGFTPQKSDLVDFIDYNSRGKSWRSWGTIPVSGLNGAFVSDQPMRAKTLLNDMRPYSEILYDPYGMDTPVRENGVGEAFSEHGVLDALHVNKASGIYACNCYSIQREQLIASGVYPAGTLSVIETTDEDGRRSLVFKDRMKLTVAEKQIDGQTECCTYYVYTTGGDLGYVLPPALEGNIDSAALSKYAYVYKYDGLHRMTEKKLPGCEPIHYYYDKADRIVFTQDGNQYLKGEYSFTLYNLQGQIAVTGVCKCDNPRIFETYLAFAIQEGGDGYCNSGYTFSLIHSATNIHLSQVNYYDTYDYLDIPAMASHKVPLSYLDKEGYSTRYVNNRCSEASSYGRLTGSRTFTSDDNNEMIASYYYDDRGNLVQSSLKNHLGTYEHKYMSYTFSNKVSSSMHIYDSSANKSQSYFYTYDHADRLIRVAHRLNSSSLVVLSENEYDEYGRLKQHSVHDKMNSSKYSYNLRNWLTEITNPQFSQTLHYIDGAGTPQYGGNISSMSWRAGGESVIRGYQFGYDALSRLKEATYGEGNTLTTNANRFTEQVTSYDKMGNILGLKRYGQSSATDYSLIDNLSLTYDGNQLKNVTDKATSSAFNNGFEFKDGANVTIEYEYDKNGNLTKDLNKKITDIQYNYLNLPSRIQFEGGNSISYVYGADGTKLRTTHIIDEVTTTTDYCGSVIYENGIAKTLLTEAGFVSLNDNKYHYYLQDHQGNNRVVASQDGVVEEVNHYYPFGGIFASTSSVQPYKYNGKDLDRKGGLDWYDYGARMYDATLGRFMKTDRFSEKYVSLSPYQYGANNPVNNIDINGDSIWYTLNDNIVTMHVTTKIFNNSSDNINMKRAAKDIASDIKSSYEGEFEWSDGKIYNLKVDMDLKVVTSMKDVESADHLFVLADSDGEGARGATSMSGGKVMTLASKDFADDNWLSNNLSHNNTFTATHEFGHAAGLPHSKNPFNIMKQGGVFHNSNSAQRKIMLQQQYNINRGSNSLNYMNRKIPYPYVHYDNNIVDVYSLGLKWR